MSAWTRFATAIGDGSNAIHNKHMAKKHAETKTHAETKKHAENKTHRTRIREPKAQNKSHGVKWKVVGG